MWTDLKGENPAIVNSSYPKLVGITVKLLTKYEIEGSVSYMVEYYDKANQEFKKEVLSDFNLTLKK